MNAARRVNLRDIAEASGVSIQTVSRAVRGLDVVAEPTRSRVMEAVERLGYRPNLAARALVTRDKLVLKLGRRPVIAARFAILSPERLQSLLAPQT